MCEKQFDATNDVDISVDIARNMMDFDFYAFNGKYGHNSDRIYMIPVKMPPFSVKSDMCMSYFRVNYNISFPLKITLTDISPASLLKFSAEDNNIYYALRLNFYVVAYLTHYPNSTVNTHGVDNSLRNTSEYVAPSHGNCKFEIKVENSASGRIFIDRFRYEYTNHTFSGSNLMCGSHRISVYPDEIDLAPHIRTITIKTNTILSLNLSRYFSLKGHVYMKKRVFCREDKRLIDLNPKLLKYVDGNPPAYIEVWLVDLHSGKTVARTCVNTEGYYIFSRIPAGEYLLFARSSTDSDNRPAYRVEFYGSFVEIRRDTDLDIFMNPLSLVKTEGGYTEVTEVRDRCP